MRRLFRSSFNRDDATYNLSILCLSGLVAATVLWDSGVRQWGAWYSNNYQLQDQTKALVRGSLSIASDPGAIGWDYVWGDGVQQPWGLGVPLWQAIFELGYRVIGWSYFPDRLALGAAALAASIVVMRTFISRPFFKAPLKELHTAPESLAPIFLLLLFPPFLTMCCTRMAVYEEVVVYSYLFAVVLMAGTIAFYRKASFSSYLLLSILAGLSVFVRPTILTYGLVSQVVNSIQTRRLGWSIQKSLAGIACFVLITASLFLTNYWRFGSPLEFGHKLTLNTETRICYSSRFYDPYSDEPLDSAAQELFSLLFLINKLNGDDWYANNILPGQSETVRWREFYFKTFDLSYFIFVVASWVSLSWHWYADWRSPSRDKSWSESRILLVWSLFSVGALAIFYLRFPFVASRYMIDFAPAFAAAMLGGIFMLGGRISSARKRLWLTGFLYLALVFWWGLELKTARIITSRNFPPVQLFSLPISHTWQPARKLPSSYKLGDDLKVFGILFNGTGWNMKTGEAYATCSFFVSDPTRLELQLVPLDGANVGGDDYKKVEAKIGLEKLELEAIQDEGEVHRILFRRPKQSRYQSGVQVLFLRLPFGSKCDWKVSKFRLLSVAWR